MKRAVAVVRSTTKKMRATTDSKKITSAIVSMKIDPTMQIEEKSNVMRVIDFRPPKVKKIVKELTMEILLHDARIAFKASSRF